MIRTRKMPGGVWRLGLVVGVLAGGAMSAAPTTDDKPVTHSLPATTRSYQILLPAQNDRKNMPLVLYLHASSRPAPDELTKALWPLLAQKKCALLMPQAGSAKMWLSGDDQYIMDCLADAQTRYSIDPKRIILMGLSGGAQTALFLADHVPEKFRAVAVFDSSPVTIRGDKIIWFYPNRQTLKTCPYLVVNRLSEGADIMYWRQVKAKLAPLGASISILPQTGKEADPPAVPKELGPWLDDVLAGKQPAPLVDPQQEAVAKMFAPAAEALPKAVTTAKSAATQPVSKDAAGVSLSLKLPAGIVRSKDPEDKKDSTGADLNQIRLESAKWPIFIRCEARATDKTADQVLSAEEADMVSRGLLYQVYGSGQATGGGREWKYRIGSITYPDRRRGWVSALFIMASAPIDKDPKRWLSVIVVDETQQPDPAELAGILRGCIETLSMKPAATGSSQ